VRPRIAENVGAAARALANFGLEDWVLVAPEEGDPAAARRLAVHAERLLEGVRVAATLDEAVADCALVVGTAARRVRGRHPLLPEEAARAAVEAAPRGRTALVFGGERDGLSAAELRRCDAISAVPTDSRQPSLNLAQAVVLYAHAVARAFAAGPAGAPPRGDEAGGPGPREGAEGRAARGAGRGADPAAGGRANGTDAFPGPRAGATDAELLGLEEALRGALRAGGFLAGPERHAVRDLAATLRRARLSPREARLWNAALRRLARGG
jgi:tRNA/rRNA methyltransferase